VWSESVIEATVVGLGYELVDVEWAGGGVLRVFIDKPVVPGGDGDEAHGARDGVGDGVSVDDCARVSEQLSLVFTVENVHYERLEISSPGLDRPLKRPADFERFVGHEAFVKLRVSPDGQARGRRQFQGVLQRLEGASEVPGEASGVAGRMGLVVEDKEGGRALLEFSFDEVEKARLVPQIDFRSHGGSKKR